MFLNSLNIHEEKTKEIPTVKEVWKCGLNYHKIWRASFKISPVVVGHGPQSMLGQVVGSRSVVTNLRAVRISRNDKFSLQKGTKSVNSTIYSISFLRLPFAHID